METTFKMAHINIILVVVFLTLSTLCAAGEVKDNEIVAARIESCKGCQLNRLPEVKKFIYEDVPLFSNVVFKPIQGAPPELIFLNDKDQELERIALNSLSREQCNGLLTSKGFSRSVPNSPTMHHSDF